MSGLFLYFGSANSLKCFVNVEFRPGPVAIISSSLALSAIILFTMSSISGNKAAKADAPAASDIAADIEGPVGNAPAGGGGGGGGGPPGGACGGLPGCGGAGAGAGAGAPGSCGGPAGACNW